MENDSSVTNFLLMGLTDQPELQWPLFFLFLVNYVATVVGNLSLMSLICLNSHLHTPMYFFLFNLSCIDFCYSFVCTPKTLMSFVSAKNFISFTECVTQMFFFCLFVNSECYVLTAMAYDRYVAICQPLLYAILMPPRVCSLLMVASHLMGFATALVHTTCIVRLSFCNFNINHYMCDTFPLFELSCGSTHNNELVSSVAVAVVIIVSGLIILTSYALILFNIINLSSSVKGLSKAMSTCGSHIITVALFYGFGLLAHVRPSSSESMIQGKFFSVFYTFVLPLMNPLIYSLKNKDVKLALERTLRRLRK